MSIFRKGKRPEPGEKAVLEHSELSLTLSHNIIVKIHKVESPESSMDFARYGVKAINQHDPMSCSFEFSIDKSTSTVRYFKTEKDRNSVFRELDPYFRVKSK
ncbi:MAG: hypothetical protein KGH98_01345, partial [Candidatus Micrarchaeota archaeon]|nr:hypothetical protein [Candidatus Micrarchaeota archaeon]